MKPTEIKALIQPFEAQSRPGKVPLIVIDSNEGTAHITDTLEHRKQG
ncbi:hypothetical protein [Bacillus altitudinis]